MGAFSPVTYAVAVGSANAFTTSTVAIGGQLTDITRQPDGELIFTYTPTSGSPQIFSAGVVPAGRSIQSATINSDGELVLTMDDIPTTEFNVGKVEADQVEFRATDTYIQWRYIRTPADTWKNLITLEEISGHEVELQVTSNVLEWRYADLDTPDTWKQILDFNTVPFTSSMGEFTIGETYKVGQIFYTSTGEIYVTITDFTAILNPVSAEISACL